MVVRKEFIKWLEKNKHNYVCTRAYQAGSTQHCPLANFLRSKHPGADIRVFASYGRVDGRRFDLPYWARDFVRVFDSHMDCKKSARGSTALRLLHG